MTTVSSPKQETWNTKLGVILAVAGSAVGIGNFLRFPGQAAQFGGGAFMIAYVISFLIIGLPMGWAEWTMGRLGGKKGFYSCPGILNAIWKHPAAKYIGVLGVIIPVCMFMYYVYVESWCLGYAVNTLLGNLHFENIAESKAYWSNFVGIHADGSAFGFRVNQVGLFLILSFALNFYIIYKGIAAGIEKFCKYALTSLVVIALIILVRVLTLGAPIAEHPHNNVVNGLGFLWNPVKTFYQEQDSGAWVNKEEIIGQAQIAEYEALVAKKPEHTRVYEKTVLEQLKSPKLWLAAASQIFFSLSVGFGVIMVYSSYMKPDDDVVLGNLTSASANEFCEVALGGLITIPAAYAFLGAASIAGQGIFGLGFNVFPMVFSFMGYGQVFGFLFFSLLFLAAVTSSISQLQPGLAFLEETLGIGRKASVALLVIITSFGVLLTFWFSKDVKALDTFDFWVSTFLIYSIATILIIYFSWGMGVEKGFTEANNGAVFKIPRVFYFVTKYLCPLFLISIFVLWLVMDVLGVGGSGIDYHITDLFGGNGKPVQPVAWIIIVNITMLYGMFCILVSRAKRYQEVSGA